jgi:hypothetical protein
VCSEIGVLEDTFECTEVTPDSPDSPATGDDQGGDGAAGSEAGDSDDSKKENGSDSGQDADPGANCASLNDCEICSAASACLWTQTDYVMYVVTQCESKRAVASSGNSPVTCSEQADNFYRILGGGVFAVVVAFFLVKRLKGEGLAGSQGRAADRKGAVQLRTEDSENRPSMDESFDVESWGGQVDSKGENSDDLDDLDDWDAFSDDNAFPKSDVVGRNETAPASVNVTVEMTERSTPGKAIAKTKKTRKIKPKASLVKELRERGLTLAEARKAAVAVDNGNVEAAFSWAKECGFVSVPSINGDVRQGTPGKPTKVTLNLKGKVRKSDGKKKKRSAKKKSNLSLAVTPELPNTGALNVVEPVLSPGPSPIPPPAVSGKPSTSQRATSAPAQTKSDIFDLFGMEAEPSFDATPLASGNSPVMSPDPPSVEPKKVISLSTSPRGLNNDSDTGWDDDDLDNLFE